MGKLTDVAIRAWIKAAERFDGRTDGDGLVLTWWPDRTTPHGRLRYWFCLQVARDEPGQLHRPAAGRSSPTRRRDGSRRKDGSMGEVSNPIAIVLGVSSPASAGLPRPCSS